MKLIHTKEKDNTERYFNPIHVKNVKVVKSEYNQQWCIVLNLDGVTETNYTILCISQEDLDKKLEEILEAMESINMN